MDDNGYQTFVLQELSATKEAVASVGNDVKNVDKKLDVFIAGLPAAYIPRAEYESEKREIKIAKRWGIGTALASFIGIGTLFVMIFV